MAKSVANNCVPSFGEGQRTEQEKNYRRAPVTPTMDNDPEEKPISQTRYNYRWRITFPTPENQKMKM
eukprot:9423158-Ditylum_brightwellii.AAC.1